MANWREERDTLLRELDTARIAARNHLENSVQHWMTMTASRQTELDEIAAKHSALLPRIHEMRAAQDAHEARFTPLHEDVLARIEEKNAARVELATQQSLARQADGKVARTDEMLDEQARCARELERVTEHRRLVGRRFEAREQHENIVAYQTIAQLLGPRGVRAQAVEEAMQQFDGVLGTISRVTGWPRVRLDRHYSVSIGERKILRLCAESERLRAQWCLQIALVRVRREPVAILDAADHLDTSNLTGLGQLLDALCARKNPPAFLVCGTELDHEVINRSGPNYQLVDGVLGEMRR